MPKYHCLPLGGLMHLWISFAVLVLCRTRRADDRRIDDRTVADLDPVAGQIPVHGRQQLLAELVPFEQVVGHRPRQRSGSGELRPRHHLIHLREKLRTPSRLAVPFKARQRLLLHPIDLTRWDKALYLAGKSECP